MEKSAFYCIICLMSSATHPPISKTKRLCAGLLAIWMSGVAFLLCCGATAGTQAAEMERCPLAKKGHCSKSISVQPAAWIGSSQEDVSSIDCCAFLPQLFSKFRKTEKGQQIAVMPAKLQVKRVPVVFTEFEPTVFFNYRSQLFNRGNIYLKNRVFRI